jgi:hypothetical protein
MAKERRRRQPGDRLLELFARRFCLTVAERTAEFGHQLFADKIVGLVDLALDQRAIGGAIGQGVGQRLPVGGNLLALLVAEKVEEPDRLQTSSTRPFGVAAGTTTARSRRTGGNAETGW